MSNLRCKVGDLAVVVAAPYTPELVGRFVIVDRVPNPIERIGGHKWDTRNYGPVWVIRGAAGGTLPMRLKSGAFYQATERVLLDSCLRPIRPNDGEDESLSWSRPIAKETETA
jgi:hypothetical protein